VLETAWLAQRLIENAGLKDAQPTRLIYLARTDTKARVILNEQALIERLAGMGFEIHTATGKPLVEQMRIFREAKFVVAPHGAGLTNIIFAHPGIMLLELVQSTYQNTGMMRLAQAAGVRYYSELFFPENGGKADRSWRVDIERIAAAVEKMLNF
jgi:capsular polysaccharide biosynthesis protein